MLSAGTSRGMGAAILDGLRRREALPWRSRLRADETARASSEQC